MAKGFVSSSESRTFYDRQTGTRIRQVTTASAHHHHPFFIIPAYDDAMQRLFFVSHRTGTPQIFAEERSTGELRQLTDRPDLSEWSVHPSHNGKSVFFTAGTSGWRLNLATLEERELVNFTATEMRDEGMIAAAMGTTALSHDDKWWAVRFKVGAESALAIVDTDTGDHEIILRKDSIAHLQFCPDDSNLLYYAGPLTDRVWVIHRDGSGNRRLYARNVPKNEWITHETWIPGTRELAFVDWPRGVRCVNVDIEKERQVTTFNAWHAICNKDGTLMVADTNFPDIGIQTYDPRDGIGEPKTLCYPNASSIGEHWNGPFPYADGPITVYAPQHTHSHPSFSPDGKYVVYTSDRSGFAQIYEATLENV
ncbi:MAG: oligogalacturonate lyase family protein [Candidatus Poribacteria bacterium]|nr:oligogalacturonate lyase family protein [Candidatus Poribacteria bacterium]